VRLRAIVNTPLPAGSLIETRAAVSFDEAAEFTLRSESLRVRSAHALPDRRSSAAVLVLDAAAGRAGVRFPFRSAGAAGGRDDVHRAAAGNAGSDERLARNGRAPHADQVRLAAPPIAAAVLSLALRLTGWIGSSNIWKKRASVD